MNYFPGLGVPEDLAVDYITSNIYFTDTRKKHIGVCSGNGKTCAVLNNEDIDKPRGIALYPQKGYGFIILAVLRSSLYIKLFSG